MSRVEVWETLPSFEMWPEKTFFGLDKSAAHCFTLPKQMTDPMIRYFGLREGKLQVPITFIIADRRYPAIVRWARLDRRNPNKLKKEDLSCHNGCISPWRQGRDLNSRGISPSGFRDHRNTGLCDPGYYNIQIC